MQHSGIHTVLQLPSNLSSVGSSALSAISCKYSIRHKSKAGTGLSNRGFFFYSTRSWGTCKVSKILVNRKPPINTSSGLYKTHLAVLCAVWLFSTWRKCEAVNRSWQIKKRKRPSNFSRYCNEMTSSQHSGIHTVLQLPSNLSCVGSSALSAISCKYGIRHKSRAGTGLSNHGFFFYFARSLRHMQSIQDPCQTKPSNQRFCQIKTHLAVLCAVWLFSTWRKCDAVNRSWQIKKRKRPSNFSRYCNEMTSWQHSGIHTVLQLPSNLSSVGSSAPSAISCKYCISPKQGLVYLITRSLRRMQSIQDSCQPKPPNQYFFRSM